MKITSYKTVAKCVSDTHGVALLYATAIIGVLALLTISLQLTLVPQLRGDASAGSALNADLAAQSALDVGIMKAKGHEIGDWEPAGYVCFGHDGDIANYLSGSGAWTASEQNCTATDSYSGTYTVNTVSGCVGVCPTTNARYIVPAPGTGNAGENCEITTNYSGASNPDENLMKPCNWNKLKFGETDAIPLYVNEAGTVDPSLNTFILRVRTPCDEIDYASDGKRLTGTTASGDPHPETSWCHDTNNDGHMRVQLEDSDPGYSPSDVIVQWSIVGDCDYTPSTGHDTADDTIDGKCVIMGVGNAVDPSFNYLNWSMIRKDTINGASLYQVLTNDKKIDDLNVNDVLLSQIAYLPSVLNYIKNTFSNITAFNTPPNISSKTYNNATLYLSLVSPLTIANGTAPYIEYQLETDRPISTPFKTITAEGNFGQHSVIKKASVRAIDGDAQFVIQS